MAWSGAGVFNRLYSWVTDAANAINITASRMDAEFNNYKTGLENCLTRDGQNSPSANLPMGGKKHTNVADAAALTEYATAKQVQKAGFNLATFGGVADAMTASLTPAPAVMTSGFKVCGFPGFNNATTTPTLAVGSIPAKTIKKKTVTGLGALAIDDIVANLYTEFTFDAVNDCFILNAAAAPGGSSGGGGGGGAVGSRSIIRLSTSNLNCTGIGNQHTIIGFSVVSDPDSCISGTDNNVFTTPATGTYKVEFSIKLSDAIDYHTRGFLYLIYGGGASQLTFAEFNPGAMANKIDYEMSATFIRYVDLTLGDTVSPAIMVHNTTGSTTPVYQNVDLLATTTSSGTSLSIERVA